MSDPIRKYVLLREFREYHNQILRLIATRSGTGEVESSYDTNTLSPGWTAESLMQPAKNALTAHISRLDNPHEETADSIGNTYSREFIDGRLSGSLPIGTLPISSFGHDLLAIEGDLASYWTLVDQASGPILRSARAMSGLLNGVPYTLPAQDYPIEIINVNSGTRAVYALEIARIDGVVRYSTRIIMENAYADNDATYGRQPIYYQSRHAERLTIGAICVIGRTPATRVSVFVNPNTVVTPTNVWTAPTVGLEPLRPVLRIGPHYMSGPERGGGTIRVPFTLGNIDVNKGFPADFTT